MRIHAIVLAAGGGTRFGGDTPKQFLRLAGEQILFRTVRTLTKLPIDQLLVVGHPSWLVETEAIVNAARQSTPAKVIAGGVTRNESTRNALGALDADDDDIVLVHDAVRPLMPPEVAQRAIAPIMAGYAEATDTVIPSADTLVLVEGDRVVEIPERARFRRGQTPQAFRREVLGRAYDLAAEAGDLAATDDCSLVLRYVPEARVLAVAGDEVNLKITTRIDLVMADRMLQLRTVDQHQIEGLPAAHSLAGAKMLVVGGTNGIGRAIAEEARRSGASVEVVGRSLGVDVRRYAALSASVDAAAERLGGLDHVIVTAGVLRVGRLVDTPPGDFTEVVEANLIGTLNVAHAAYRHLRDTRGSLTVFASSSFTRGRPDYVAYSASKAAVVNAAQGLADEWFEDDIRVNAVSPERTDTPMRRQAFPQESRTGMLAPTDVAAATLRLIQSGLTGQVLDVRRHELGP